MYAEPGKGAIHGAKDLRHGDVYLRLGLNTRDILIDTLFTNEFVADFNKFDAVAVRRQARAAN